MQTETERIELGAITSRLKPQRVQAIPPNQKIPLNQKIILKAIFRTRGFPVHWLTSMVLKSDALLMWNYSFGYRPITDAWTKNPRTNHIGHTT